MSTKAEQEQLRLKIVELILQPKASTHKVKTALGLKGHRHVQLYCENSGIAYNHNTKAWERISDEAIRDSMRELGDIELVAKRLKISASYVQDVLNKSWIGE